MTWHMKLCELYPEYMEAGPGFCRRGPGGLEEPDGGGKIHAQRGTGSPRFLPQAKWSRTATRGLEAMVRDDMACPARHSEELFGYERPCEAPRRTRGVCRECQRRFLKTEIPACRTATDEWEPC